MSEPIAIETERDAVRIEGPEAATYLQGQMSQDIDSLEVGGSAWSLLLQPTGKVDVWLRLHRLGPDTFVADVDAGHGDAAIARLTRFKLRTDVDFELEPGWSMVSVRGSGADQLGVDAQLAARVDWPGFDGVDHLGTDMVVPAEVSGADRVDFEARRIAAGFPRMGAELTSETIPAEAGPALLEASVSFTKGCYTGQELVARIDSRGGNVPRPIRVLRSESASASAPAVGAIVRADGADVGVVTSSVPARATGPALALAPVLRRVAPDSTVVVDGVEATVLVPPVSSTAGRAGS